MNHLYYLDISHQIDAQLLNRIALLLPKEKRLAFESIKHLETKRQKICAYALTSYLAKTAFGLMLHELDYKITAFGKPYFENAADFHFNISHTAGAVLVGISDFPIGVDIEKIKPVKPQIANRFFCASEIDYVFTGESGTQESRFFEVWTRKEAILKYKGTGLREPLERVNTFAAVDGAQIYTFRYRNTMISCCCEGGQPPFDIQEIPIGEILSICRKEAI